MKVRADIAELLNAGLTNKAIARQLHTDEKKVSAARTALDIPRIPGGRRPASSPEDLFWRRTQPVEGGHLLWTGSVNSTGAPRLTHGGKSYSAYRIAFRIKHGREPQGRVTPGCAVDGCVHPNCVDDRPMRERTESTFTAIFGRAS